MKRFIFAAVALFCLAFGGVAFGTGGACGEDAQCASLATLPCSTIINGHHYTTRVHTDPAHNRFYKVPCSYQACGGGIPPALGLAVGPVRSTPASYDPRNDCSDGLECHNLACDESVGATAIFRLSF